MERARTRASGSVRCAGWCRSRTLCPVPRPCRARRRRSEHLCLIDRRKAADAGPISIYCQVEGTWITASGMTSNVCPATSLTPLETALLPLCDGLQPLVRCLACATDLTAPEAANGIRGYPPTWRRCHYRQQCRFLDGSIFRLPDSRVCSIPTACRGNTHLVR